MSSNPGHCPDCMPAENLPRSAAVTWPWPVGAWGVLAGAVILAAMGLAVASLFDQPSSGEAVAVVPELTVDPNTAPARVLTALPRIGPTLVREWVAARNARPFSSLEDVQRRVRGLGPVTLAQIAPYLRFEPLSQSSRENVTAFNLRSGPSANLDPRGEIPDAFWRRRLQQRTLRKPLAPTIATAGQPTCP